MCWVTSFCRGQTCYATTMTIMLILFTTLLSKLISPGVHLAAYEAVSHKNFSITVKKNAPWVVDSSVGNHNSIKAG